MRFLVAALLRLLLAAIPAGAHPACRPLQDYQAAYVQREYDQRRHMGFYYELGFRDLYPGPPMCDCQHTTKRFFNRGESATRARHGMEGTPDDGATVVGALPAGAVTASSVERVDGNYYENFDFQCGPLPGTGKRPMPILTVIDLNRTNATKSSTKSSVTATPPRAVYTQTITKAAGMRIPKWMHSSFDTGVIAFDRSGAPGAQYNWVIEFTCGGLGALFPGGFVGLNLYSRTLSPSNLATMIDVVKSLNLSWVLEKDFHTPTHNQSLCVYNSSSLSPPPTLQPPPPPPLGPPADNDAAAGKAAAEVAAHDFLGRWPDHSQRAGAGPNPICMAVHCGKQMLACELERSMCAKGLSCTQACGKNNNTLACLYGCLNSYEDAAYSDFVRCAMTDHHCIPSPPPPAGQIKQCTVPKRINATFNVTSALSGRWYIPVGLNPVIDCYPCQYGDWTFEGAQQQQQQQQQVHFTFKVPTLQGGFRNRTLDENVSLAGSGSGVSFSLLAHADGLDQRQNFTVIAAREDVILAYWCADNNIGSLLEGVNVYTRAKQLPVGAEAWVKEQAEAAGFDYATFCQVDNTNHCEY
jgi:hypothetical protein